MIKPTIVFDLGAVLIDWNPRHLYRKMFNGRTQEMEYFLGHICTTAWNEEMDAGRPFSEAIAAKAAEFPDYEPYIAAYYARWPEMVAGAIEGTVNIFAELRQAGYATAALSNWSAETFPFVQNRFDFLHWFDEIVLSGKHRVKKPNPRLYHILLERLDREAQACLFIDDSIKNIQAAAQLGFQVLHFQSPAQLRSDLQSLGILFRSSP